jgi:hypothetical protein
MRSFQEGRGWRMQTALLSELKTNRQLRIISGEVSPTIWSVMQIFLRSNTVKINLKKK